jgi:hypothetical protein
MDNLENLNNGQLVERYSKIVKSDTPAEVDAVRGILSLNQDGFLPVNDRQIMIEYLREEESNFQNNNNPKLRRTMGGRRRTRGRRTRGRRTRGRKSRRLRKSKRGKYYRR